MEQKNTNIGFQVQEAGTEERRANLFSTLYAVNVNDKTEKKNGLTYLSWSDAWAEFKKICPSATYQIVKNPETHLPYTNDPKLGIIVETEVTVEGMTLPMWLPVLDYQNRALKEEPYTFQTYDRNERRYVEHRVEAATTFDINKALLRCLVKNLAMFGLGLYIYAKEDLPAENIDNPGGQQQQPPKTRRTRKTTPPQPNDRYAGIRMALSSVNSTEELVSLYRQHQNEVDNNPDIKALFTNRKNELAA